VKLSLPAWFDYLEESVSCKDVQFKKFCPPVKTGCPPAKNINKKTMLLEMKFSVLDVQIFKISQSC